MGIDQAFEEFPVIETDRFLLRKITIEDSYQMYSYFSKDVVTRYYDLETFTSEEQAIDLIRSLQKRYQNGSQIRWAISIKETNLLIGTCGLHAIEKEHFKAEIGYELHPDYWGKGIMNEAVRTVLSYGFNKMGLNRIEAFYDPENTASEKLLKKNEFQYEGLLRDRFFEKGKFVDAVLAAILKRDYTK